jgi:hypothetical protein
MHVSLLCFVRAVPAANQEPPYFIIISHSCVSEDRNSIVGVATRYGLYDPGIEPNWRQEISPSPHLSKLALVVTQRYVQWLPWLFLGVKEDGTWC